MLNYLNTLKINFPDFILKQEYFAHYGSLHGSNHVYRVMFHVLKLGYLLKNNNETRLAFFAAFIHDMSRLHDGKCSEHGQRAAMKNCRCFYLCSGKTA
jgi:hypothetical protein